jgi:hypothetical protein
MDAGPEFGVPWFLTLEEAGKALLDVAKRTQCEAHVVGIGHEAALGPHWARRPSCDMRWRRADPSQIFFCA